MKRFQTSLLNAARPAALAFGGLILLTVIGYLGNIKRRGKRIGVTTEVAAMLTFLFGWYSFLSRSTELH